MKELELVIKNYTPAVIDINIDEVDEFMELAKEKYADIVVSENEIKEAENDRSALNKLEKNIADVRKMVDKKTKEKVQPILDRLRSAEKETKELSNNLNNQIKEFEENKWFEKQEQITEIIDNVFREESELKLYLEKNDKWRNKTFKLDKIEEEIEEKYNVLLSKKEFIQTELEKANKEIEFKILFETVSFLITYDYADVVKEIEKKKNEIKITEENLKQKAKEQAEKEAEEKLIKEQHENKKVVVEEMQIPEMSNANTEKGTYICIKVSGLTKEATTELKNVLNKYNIEYIKEVR